jgi:hypothetical protein
VSILLARSGRGHLSEPVVVATGVFLDMRRADLGHPDDPGLWDRLHGNCRIGPPAVLKCDHPRCGEPLYLREEKGIRRAYHYGEAELSAAGYESDIHKALKDVICMDAERVGLVASQESGDVEGLRRTDVLVTGGSNEVGWEVQLAKIGPGSLRTRLRRAEGDGLVSSWLTHAESAAHDALGYRVPTSRVPSMDSLQYKTAETLRVLGVQAIEILDCAPEFRTKRWHQGLRCSGKHVRPGGPIKHWLPDMVAKTAAGTIVPVVWPYPLGRFTNARVWLLLEDAKRLAEIEGDVAVAILDDSRGKIIPDDVTAAPTWHWERNLRDVPDDLEPVARDPLLPSHLRSTRPVIGISAAGWKQGTAPHQVCACGTACPPRRDGRPRICPDCLAKGA